MSASDILKELPGLTEAQRQRVFAITARIDALHKELDELLRGLDAPGPGIDLRARGIDQEQAAELRARLKSFAEDWERPEAAIYDEDAPQ